jgi:hypothetical protein
VGSFLLAFPPMTYTRSFSPPIHAIYEKYFSLLIYEATYCSGFFFHLIAYVLYVEGTIINENMLVYRRIKEEVKK